MMTPNGHARDGVRPIRLTAADLAAVPRELLEPVPDEHARYLARDLVGRDRPLAASPRSSGGALPGGVRPACGGFSPPAGAAPARLPRRVGDYARERLGLSARELQSAAWVVTALRGLPRLATAFEAGVLSWTQLRILVTVASPATEAHWLDLARGRTMRALEAQVRKRRAGAGPAAQSPATPAPTAVSEATRESSGTQDLEDFKDSRDSQDSHSQETIIRFHLRCPRRVRRLWRRAVELARRMLGTDGRVWQAAEAIAAEGLAALPVAAGAWGSGMGDAAGRVAAISGAGVDASDRNRGDEKGTGEDGEDGAGERPLAWECLDWSAVRAAVPAEVARLADGCDRLDAFALDARLRQTLQAQRRIDWQLGRLLHSCVRLRLERLLGFPSIAVYARERLGLSPSKVRGLIAVEGMAQEVPAFGAAYEAGELSRVRALTLLPVLGERTAAAWTARAQAVTVRRLVAEVEWSLDQRDATPESAADAPAGPPPVGHDLAAEAADVERQMRARRKHSPVEGEREARPDWSPFDAEIAFAGPAAVVGLVQAAVAAFRRPEEPRWVGFERLLDHVIGEWESLPRHGDPIFDRDGWRCAVPACEARGNLHDHHVQFRSLGGRNAQANRVTVCAWYHPRGIHAGLVRASGPAPGAIRWELGLRAGQRALLSFLGDTYVDGDQSIGMMRDAAGVVAA